MAEIILTIADDQIQRVIDGVCLDNNYQTTIPDPAHPTDLTKRIANPKTKEQFMKQTVIAKIIQMVVAGESKKAQADSIENQTELDIS